MSEPVTTDSEAARVSDAMQAAYFGGVLTDGRAQPDAGLPPGRSGGEKEIGSASTAVLGQGLRIVAQELWRARRDSNPQPSDP